MIFEITQTNLINIIAIIFLIVFVLVIGLAVVFAILRYRYISFLNKHSQALKKLEEINGGYYFAPIISYDYEHSYDNENFYDNISCEDYLIYQLAYKHHAIWDEIKNVRANRMLFKDYKKDLDEQCKFMMFGDVKKIPRNEKRLAKYEKKLFERKVLSPETHFSITVELTLTNINGVYRYHKTETFEEKVIVELINLVKQKRGSFYLVPEVWDAICRVERGKVSNRLRFLVYNRDGNRCVKCGSRRNLEIDHIYPIAKGGKTTLDNLQTLCHKCNVRKGSSLDYY